jgi:3-isopropylmalate dehydrogenase
MAANDALLLGAVGDPRVPPGPLEQELLLRLRFHFDQYLNLRPAKTYPGVPTPLRLPEEKQVDVVVVRENTEDLYMNLGGSVQGEGKVLFEADRKLYFLDGAISLRTQPETEVAFALGLVSKEGSRRVARRAFELARERGESAVAAATKSNAVPRLYGFWDEQVAAVAKEFPAIALSFYNVDNLAYQLPRKPLEFGVIVCPNLFGDIISDLAAGLTGGLGLAASGNIGDSLSMFEPVHGSAPKHANSGRANPLAAVLSGAMLLKHVSEPQAAARVEKAVELYLSQDDKRALPIELGGSLVTNKVGEAVIAFLDKVKL